MCIYDIINFWSEVASSYTNITMQLKKRTLRMLDLRTRSIMTKLNSISHRPRGRVNVPKLVQTNQPDILTDTTWGQNKPNDVLKPLKSSLSCWSKQKIHSTKMVQRLSHHNGAVAATSSWYDDRRTMLAQQLPLYLMSWCFFTSLAWRNFLTRRTYWCGDVHLLQ